MTNDGIPQPNATSTLSCHKQYLCSSRGSYPHDDDVLLQMA
ncbi:hypothetical protein N9236_00490 [bacterium]|nr:hypothetical protein [bacterium]MDB4498476.1 hypothetical protein [bacterium]